MKFFRKHFLGYVAVAVACIMIGSCLSIVSGPSAQAEENKTAQQNVTIVTSPFTAAVAKVRSSVVGVSNYQTVRYRTYPDNSWGNFGFGFGFGYGGGYDDYGSVQEQEVEAATGSGVVIGKGYVLTNYHVVEEATALKITVAKDGSDEPEAYNAALVAYDENLDVAIVYCPELKLEPVTLGDSDSLMVGDWAICIGNPLGTQFSGTVTTGVVSALNRAVSSSSTDKYGRKATVTNAMIQVDAAINSGNSGGGMFSVTGELMGIPTLKYSGSAFSGATVEGIGMCIPINAAKPLIEDVLSGKVELPEVPATTDASTVQNTLEGKPRMGITMTSITSIGGLSNAVRSNVLPYGAFVTEVEKGGPAEAAGIKRGDIIVDVNDTVITSTSQLIDLVGACKEGDELKVKVYRVPGFDELEDGSTIPNPIPDGEYVDLTVVLAVVDDTNL